MQCEAVPGSAAMRKLLPEPDEHGSGWQLQLGMACALSQSFVDWWCVLTWHDVPRLHGGGGCKVTASAPGTYTVLPDNGTVHGGQRAVVALRVLGTDAAPAAVQFHATPRTGPHLLVRCATVAVRTSGGASAAATPATWPGIDTCDRGRATAAPWHDWTAPDPAEFFKIEMSVGTATDRNTVQDAINKAAQGFARGGFVRQPGAVA